MRKRKHTDPRLQPSRQCHTPGGVGGALHARCVSTRKCPTRQWSVPGVWGGGRALHACRRWDAPACRDTPARGPPTHASATRQVCVCGGVEERWLAPAAAHGRDDLRQPKGESTTADYEGHLINVDDPRGHQLSSVSAHTTPTLQEEWASSLGPNPARQGGDRRWPWVCTLWSAAAARQPVPCSQGQHGLALMSASERPALGLVQYSRKGEGGQERWTKVNTDVISYSYT